MPTPPGSEAEQRGQKAPGDVQATARPDEANAFRSALAEFGVVAAQGLKGLRSLMEALDDPASAIPEAARMPRQATLGRHLQAGQSHPA